MTIAWKVSHSETKPLKGGSAEIATEPMRKTKAVIGHAVDETAEMVHVALVGGDQHRARSQEEQALEHGVVEDVEQRRRQRQRRQRVDAVGAEGERQAQADDDDADVLDRVIGEQALQIVLHHRVEHTQQRGDAAEQQHHHAPPPLRGPARSKSRRMRP